MFSPANLVRYRLALTAVTLAALGWYLYSRPRLDLASLDLHWGKLAFAGLCVPVLLFLRAAKWRIILKGPAPDITLMQSLRSYLGASALALVTPGRVGEFSRGLYLTQPAVQGWRGAGLVVLDNWLDTLAVLAWACPGWLACLGWGGLALGPALFLALAPIPLWLRLVSKVASRLPRRWGLRDWAGNCLAVARGVPAGNLIGGGVLSLAAYGLEWLQFWFLLGFLVPVAMDPFRMAGLMALVSLANSFQVTLAGLGIREGMAMLLLGTQGVESEPAVMAAFFQTVLVLILPAVLGLGIKPVPWHRRS
ncbi:MAG: lysylphosphatidylglycerol synthase transmembrane domain-containing protein [Fibrobacteria bacterium]